MKSKHFFSATVLCAAALTLSGCGGGGTSADAGGTSSGTASLSVTATPSTLQAGSSTTLKAHAIIRGATPNSMVWSIAPIDAVGANDPRPQIGDTNCSTATFVPPVAAGMSGESACQTILTVPSEAKSGTWRVTNTAKTESGISVSNSQVITVTAQPAVGFRLLESSAPVYGYVNKLLTLSVPFTVNPGTTVSDIRYEWTAADDNPTKLPIAGAKNSIASVVPPIHGQYRFDVKATALIGGVERQVNGSVIAVINPIEFVDVIDAGAPQFVNMNQGVRLQGTILNRDDTLVYAPSWRQLDGIDGGPIRVELFNANSYSPSFIATTPGTYQFEFKVIKNQPDGRQVTSTTKTGVVVQTQSVAGFGFTASAGDIKTSTRGTPTVLQGSVTPQGNISNVVYEYLWTQTGGPATTISNDRSAVASFLPTVDGLYSFNLNVRATTDRGTSSVNATTQVSVSSQSTTPTNVGFALSATASPAMQASTNSVTTLTGSQVTQGDSAGVTYSYRWTQTAGPTLTLSNPTSTGVSFVPTTSGNYSFTFEVTATLPNGTTRTASAQTQVIVGGTGSVFSVSAGDAQTVVLNTPAVMQGSVLSQGFTGGATLTYQWEQIGSTPATVTLSNANSLGASFVPTAVGVYTFRLTVTSTDGGTAVLRSATTQVLVTPTP